jgi:hypothetical protein
MQEAYGCEEKRRVELDYAEGLRTVSMPVPVLVNGGLLNGSVVVEVAVGAQ